MTPPPTLAPAELAAIEDPAALLERAWELEPATRLSDRNETLDRLQSLLDTATPPTPPGRCRELELIAERAAFARGRALAAVSEQLHALGRHRAAEHLDRPLSGSGE